LIYLSYFQVVVKLKNYEKSWTLTLKLEIRPRPE